jgi:DMSO/TMAO reductase YedYZ molybdopterin-dependent catalytic subunit
MGFFTGTPRNEFADRLPPGQTLYTSFPVLTYGPVPQVSTDSWRLTIDGLVETPISLTWDELMDMPRADMQTDIHCVTRWTKLDTTWTGVWIDDLLARAKPLASAKFLLSECYGDYTSNVPLAETQNHQAMIAHTYNGEPLEPSHGGPARLLIPGLYFWKSSKWVTRLTLSEHDQPGLWEQNGYHNHGDPWREERYS